MEVIKRASMYLEAYFDHSPCWDEKAIIGELPTVLMKELVQYIRVDTYDTLDVLKDQSQLLIHHIARHFKLQFYGSGEIVYRQHDTSIEWYHVTEGAIVMTQHSRVFENSQEISSEMRDMYRSRHSQDDDETNRLRVRREFVSPDESDGDKEQCFETIATDVILKDGHFGLFETVFGLKRSRNAVCVQSSKLLQLDKEDLCRIVEYDDEFLKLLKKTIREKIFQFEGEMGPWTRQEIEYVSSEVNLLQKNEFASKKLLIKKMFNSKAQHTTSFGNSDRSIGIRKAWISPHPCAVAIRKKYWNIMKQRKKETMRRPTKSKEKRKSEAKRRWTLVKCVGSLVRAKRVRISLLRYLNECSNFDTGLDSTHHENHHWSNRDEKMLHSVVSRLGHTFRSLETMSGAKNQSVQKSERAVATLLMRCGYVEWGTEHFGDDSVSSKYSE